jgi:hypothetical protein
MVDVQILGRHIPKGTDVFMLCNGSSKIDEALRRVSAQAPDEKIGSWKPDDMPDFKPERWLGEEDGAVVFDASAEPHITFGLGPRGCFGRRLAYIELRLTLVLLIWNLELQRCSEEFE